MKATLDKVLKQIKPTPAETRKFQRITTQFLKKLNFQLKNEAKAILGGSGEKDTWLSGSHDIDIFVLFDFKKYHQRSAELADILEEKLKKAKFKPKRLHGSRDYFQLTFQNYLFEIIPIIKISQAAQAVNITDISPLHAQWLKKAGKKITDQIRLAKRFAQANECYGAESYINGFSGYVLEIATIYYGSFPQFLQAAAKWELRDIIDIEKSYKNWFELFKSLNQSKLQSPLIVIDPVDKTRNAAAALSLEKFLLFKEKAQSFLKNPSLSFFEKEALTFKSLSRKTLHNLLYLELTPLSGKEDVVGTKLLKAFQYLKEKLKGFEVQEAGWDWDRKNKALFYFILEKRQVEPFTIRPGPPLKMEDAVKAFRKRNKDIYEERDRLFARIPLKHFQLRDYFKNLLKDNYVKDRVKAVKAVKFS